MGTLKPHSYESRTVINRTTSVLSCTAYHTFQDLSRGKCLAPDKSQHPVWSRFICGSIKLKHTLQVTWLRSIIMGTSMAPQRAVRTGLSSFLGRWTISVLSISTRVIPKRKGINPQFLFWILTPILIHQVGKIPMNLRTLFGGDIFHGPTVQTPVP